MSNIGVGIGTTGGNLTVTNLGNNKDPNIQNNENAESTSFYG